jgi:hypothetical protein
MLCAVAVIMPMAVAAQGTFHVRFDQDTYLVAPGGSVSVGVVIDPGPEAGLFSYGLKIAFEETRARVESASAVHLPPPLDYNGVLGPGAIRLIEAGTVGVKGTVDFFISPAVSYRGTSLGGMLLQDVGNLLGTEYPLTVELFRTLGETESVFVDGTGAVLDDRIIFGSAMVRVVPEPTALMLMPVALVLVGWSYRAVRAVGDA